MSSAGEGTETITKSSSGKFSRSILWAFSCVVLAAYAILFVAKLGVNVIYWDSWSQVSMFVGRVSLPLLWAQHNENRMLIPNALTYWLGQMDRFNGKTEMLVSVAFLAISLGILLWNGAKQSRYPLLLMPIPVILCSLVQWDDSLWGFQLAWYMVLACATVSCISLTIGRLRWFAVATLAALLASFSSLQGLLLWPVGLILLFNSPASARQRIIWTVLGTATTMLYFYKFNWTMTGMGSVSYLLRDKMAALHFLLVSLGSAIFDVASPANSFEVVTVLGFLVLVIGITTLVDWLRFRRVRLSVPAGLVIFGLLFDLTLVAGRFNYGLAEAQSSRYTLYNLSLIAGVYMYWGIRAFGKGRGFSAMVFGFILPLVVLQVVSSLTISLPAAQSQYWQREWSADVLINLPSAPSSDIAQSLYPDPSYVALVYPEIRSMRLSTFSSNLASPFERLGLVPSDYFSSATFLPRQIGLAIRRDPKLLIPWKVLWAVYQATPTVQASIPQSSKYFAMELLTWAIADIENHGSESAYLFTHYQEYATLYRMIKPQPNRSNGTRGS